VIASLLVGLTSTHAAWSQGEANVTLGEPELDNFPTVRVPVAVTNANGVPILDLDASAFEVSEDGNAVPVESVTSFINSDIPIAVALVLDLSTSASIEEIRAAANQFLDHLQPNDRVALIGFNEPLDFTTFDPTKEIGFTDNLDAVRSVVNGLEAGGNSAVYEAIHRAVLLTEEETAGRRAVIVMTDGFDQASRPSIATAATPREAARERGIPVFTVGVYNPNYASDPDYLNVLARETGGRYQEAANTGELATLFRSVVDQLRTEYEVEIRSEQDMDGRDHVLMIRAVTSYGTGQAERTVSYPLPTVPRITKLQRDVNGELRDVEAGTELRGRVWLVPQISARNPIAEVEYYVDGNLAQTVNAEVQRGQATHEPWEWRWNTVRLPQGEHTLAIVAYDDAGNVSNQFSAVVNIQPTIIGYIVQNIWLVIGIVAVVVLLAVVLFILLGRRESRQEVCDTCGRVLDPSWGGVCQFCAQEREMTTISASSAEPEGFPEAPPMQPPPAHKPTSVMGAPPAREGVAWDRGAPASHKTEQIRREPPTMGWLIVEKGAGQGREFRLHEVTTIGRSGDNDIVLDDTAVSRQHAKVRMDGKVFTIFDLAATNPTQVNGQEIGKHQLMDGDRVEIGKSTLVFKQVGAQ
jgi:VWFA-related protein